MKEVWGEMWGSVLECGRSEGRCKGYGILYPFFPTPTSTFPLPRPSLPPHLPFPPPTLLHTPTHFSISPSTLPHSFHIPPILVPTPQLLKIPNSSTIHTPPNSLKFFITPSFFPILSIFTLSFTPYQNFSLFSSIVKLIQHSSSLETPRKFHKKKL